MKKQDTSFCSKLLKGDCWPPRLFLHIDLAIWPAGRSAIGRTQCYLAVVPADENQLGSKLLTETFYLYRAFCSRADTAMNSGPIANAFTLAANWKPQNSGAYCQPYFFILMAFWNWNKKKHGTVILGRELAEATKRENERIKSGNLSPSPLPDYNYARWSDEQSLINPVRNELDDRILTLTEEFDMANECRQQEIRRSISQDNIYTLLEFVRRATLYAVRDENLTNLRNAVIAVGMIETERCDYRDVLVALSFIFFGIHQLNLNETTIFEEAKKLAHGKTKELIEQFQQRPTGSKTTEAFSYIAVRSSYGISFIQSNTARYNPKKNLINILFEFGSILADDKYRKGEITLERDIPPNWLNPEGDKRVEGLLSNPTGCASLRAILKTKYHSQAAYQNLYVYLAEYGDVESPQVLTQKAKVINPKGIVRMALAEGKIFCLVVQRSIMVDMKEFETSKSLHRFEEQLRDTIKRV